MFLLKYTLAAALLLAATLPTQAQRKPFVTQSLRGVVIDAIDDLPLPDAVVRLLPSEVPYGVVTDENGAFYFKNLPIGRYQLKISRKGYGSVLLAEVLVESGKETVKTIALHTVSDNSNNTLSVIGRPEATLGVQPFTVERTQRYAATFYDPARLVTAFAGAVNDNDRGNNLIVRGNSPNGTVWNLEGAEIVNPNHIANAGTFSNRIAQSGGEFNILSAQLLEDSYFLQGGLAMPYGNALGGVLDLRLRRGNAQQREHTLQLGMVGLDFTTEGFFKKGKPASYLVNYRYSTLGLMHRLGLGSPNERTNFQDISFNVYVPTENYGTLTFFGTGGESSNFFKAARNSDLWLLDKDRQDIDFNAGMLAVGVTHHVPIADKGTWKTTFVGSSMTSTRNAELIEADYLPRFYQLDNAEETKVSFASRVHLQLLPRIQLLAGIAATQYIPSYRYGLFYTQDSTEITADGYSQGWLFRPYANFNFRLSAKLSAEVGLGISRYATNETGATEPRLLLNYDLAKNQTFSLSYRLQSQLQSPLVYFGAKDLARNFLTEDGVFGYNSRLEMTKSHQFAAAYNIGLLESVQIHAEAYYQQLFDVPITTDPNSTFSALNNVDEVVQDTLINAGTGRNYGLELTVQRFITQGYYFLWAASLYESKYTAADGIERDTRFNGNYSLRLTSGKEFQWQSFKNRGQVIGFNIRLNYLGGLRTTPIDVTASQQRNETVLLEKQAFTEQFPSYFRTDLRLYYKKNHPKYTATFALDIQNLTNTQNVAYQYFDRTQQSIVQQYQLGFLPVLTYRIDF